MLFSISAPTIPLLFLSRVLATSSRVAVTYFDRLQNGWCDVAWIQFANDVAAYTRKLQSHVAVQQNVLLLSENRYEWMVVDLAIQFLGAVSVPLHSTSTEQQVRQIADHCNADFAIVSDRAQLAKIASSRSIQGVATFDAISSSFDSLNEIVPLTLERLNPLESTRNTVERLKERLLERSVQSENLFTILYTSGTTGEPKGVMLSHRNVLGNVHSKLQTLPLCHQDRRLCWLPMSHIFARTCDLYTGYSAGCHSIVSLGRDAIWPELKHFQPTFLNAVPYFYEKCVRTIESTKLTPRAESLQEFLGGRMKLCNCGGAPLADYVFDYFTNHGIELICGYGLTETSPVLSSNRAIAKRKGSVGQAVPGVELRISDDGEVLARGDNIMLGYYLDAQETEMTIQDGWLHTGDLGYLDPDGFLFLTGRKRELIITTGGKKIAPAAIENLILADNLFEQILVVGDGQDYLTALVVIATQECDAAQLNGKDFSQEQILERIQQRLAGLSQYEQIGKVHVVDLPFTNENGLLTPKGSLRRPQILLRYQEAIEAMYKR